MDRRLAAILATDMVGYSRLMETDQIGTITRLKAHRKALIDPEIERNLGQIIKTTGDGLLVMFYSAEDAVRGASARGPKTRASPFASASMSATLFSTRETFSAMR